MQPSVQDFCRVLRDEDGKQILVHLTVRNEEDPCLFIRFIHNDKFEAIAVPAPEPIQHLDMFLLWFYQFEDKVFLEAVKLYKQAMSLFEPKK